MTGDMFVALRPEAHVNNLRCPFAQRERKRRNGANLPFGHLVVVELRADIV